VHALMFLPMHSPLDQCSTLFLAAISAVTAIPAETARDEQQHELAVALLQSEAAHPCAVVDWDLLVQSGFQGQNVLVGRVFKDRQTQLQRDQGAVIMTKVRVQVGDFLTVINRTGKRIYDQFRQFRKDSATRVASLNHRCFTDCPTHCLGN
jgi:hypothetical protein